MQLTLKQKQTLTIASIKFWGQFASYCFSAILILYLTKPIAHYGLGFSQEDAYAFQGVSKAMIYAVIMVGGFIADKYIGLRRSILIGGFLLAVAFLLVFISGFLVHVSNLFFVAAYASIPIATSLLMGTGSGMVSKIWSDDKINAKGAMTFYYIAINLGSFVAFIVAPFLIDYKYGPLSILLLVFLGKGIAAANFAWRYSMYDNVVEENDRGWLSKKNTLILISYIVIAYLITVTFFYFPDVASIIIMVSCIICLLIFFIRTMTLSGETRIKQLVGLVLILVAVVFYIIYNQMESTMVMVAKDNSTLTILGLHIKAAHYQLINPFVVIFGGFLLMKIYPKLPRFTIPYQFTTGILLAGFGLLAMWYGFEQSEAGIINGNYLALTYLIISLSELFVSAIGLSMIGLYCDLKTIGFAMGAWYIASSLANAITAKLNQLVALPEGDTVASHSAALYKVYFFNMGISTLIIGGVVFIVAFILIKYMRSREIVVV